MKRENYIPHIICGFALLFVWIIAIVIVENEYNQEKAKAKKVAK